jgi:hypothetical protein
MSRLRAFFRGHRSDERGSALVLALIFLTVCGLTIGSLMTYSNTSSAATTALRKARGTDYDADAAINGAIAKLRTTGATCGTGASGYTPTWTLNNTSVPVRVDCFQLSSSGTQRDDVLSVCPTSVAAPCPDASSLLRAEIIFYDTPTWGASVGIQTWSDQ